MRKIFFIVVLITRGSQAECVSIFFACSMISMVLGGNHMIVLIGFV